MNKRRQFKHKMNHQLAKNDSDVDRNSKIVEQFQSYAIELEDKQDRHERIVKISRDITIESKRLIFYLHTYRKEMPDSEMILEEAKVRLSKIIKTYFVPIVNELKDLNMYQFQKAFCFGVQEFVEAFSFYYYLTYQKLMTFENLSKFLEENLFTHNEFLEKEEFEESEKNVQKVQSEEKICEVRSRERLKKQNVDSQFGNSDLIVDHYYFVSILDYILGLSDLTGELMRYCINQVGAGHMETASDVCRFLTNLYTAMLSVGCSIREYNRKMYTTIENVRKVEMACYTVRVRGSEMPKHMIMSVLDKEECRDEMNY